MSDTSGSAPARPSQGLGLAVIPESLKALLPFAPFALVAWALGSASMGAPENAWLPLLVAGSVLIDPKAGSK